jgi:hypothetical protein
MLVNLPVQVEQGTLTCFWVIGQIYNPGASDD